LDGAAGRHEDAGEHLDGGRLAGTVGTEVADELALVDGERHAVDGTGSDVLAGEQGPQRAQRTVEPLRTVALLDEVVDVDDEHAAGSGVADSMVPNRHARCAWRGILRHGCGANAPCRLGMTPLCGVRDARSWPPAIPARAAGAAEVDGHGTTIARCHCLRKRAGRGSPATRWVRCRPGAARPRRGGARRAARRWRWSRSSRRRPAFSCARPAPRAARPTGPTSAPPP